MTPAAEKSFRRALVATVLVLSLVKAFLHEPWRDEWGPWGVAEASSSYRDFVENLRYGGHPRLWHSIVFAIHRTIGAFFAVQVLQALVATATVWVVARWAPFPATLRALFAFGYFAFFEYGTIARPYGIMLLLSCAACALCVRRPRDPLPLALVLALLMQTTVYGLFVAGAIAASWAVEALRTSRRSGQRPPAAATFAACVLLCAAAVLCVAQMSPPPDTGFATPWHLGPDPWRAGVALRTVVAAFVPIPRPQYHFWNTTLLDQLGYAAAVAGAIWLVIVAVLLWNRPAALTLWIAGTGTILAFTFAKFDGSLRHHGQLFVTFVAASWIAASAGADSGTRTSCARRVVFATVLSIQAVGGLGAAAADAVLPFSASGRTAQFLREAHLEHLPLVGDRDATTAGVASALGRPIYYPSSRRTSTFVVWDSRRQHRSPDAVILAAAAHVRGLGGGDVVIVLDRALNAPPEGVTLAARFEESVVDDERFHVYLDRRPAR